MKKLFLVLMTMMGIYSVTMAQPGKKPTTAPKAPATKPAPATMLKTQADSVSYVLGESAAYNLMQQGFGDVKINSAAFNKGFTDILNKRKPAIDDQAASAVVNNYYFKMQAEKSKPNIEAGRKFLEENKKKPGIITTASGLQYEVIKEGTGIKPTLVDTFVCDYRGTLLSGAEFDASYNRGQPLQMGVNQVINGWKEGLQLMSVGSKYKFYIPYNLGYGEVGSGQIPGGSTLVFDVELHDVKKKKE
jgi:FKBP-type peptidyl-prolyl cis-trans isomerase